MEQIATEKLARTTAMAPPVDAIAVNAVTLPRVVASDDPPSSAPLTIDFDAMNAKLKAAGVQVTDTLEPPAHGLTVQKSAGRAAAQVGG